MRQFIVATTILLIAACGSGSRAAGQEILPNEVRQGFDVRVPLAPALFRVEGRQRLMHELHLSSFARASVTLMRVEVLDASSGRVLHGLEGEALWSATGSPGADQAPLERAVFEGGRRKVIYLDAVLDDGAMPTSVRHRLHFDVQTPGGGTRVTVSTPAIAVAATAVPVLGPPLRGGPWTAVYDPGLVSGHRRYLYAIDGVARIPGRHAIDWMAAAPSGTASRTPGDGYGAEVLAVADARVAAARDDMAERAAGEERPPTALGDATGNYIALDLGDGRYAFYEHLAPGVRVRAGDRVRKGQVIARLGATGQASRPHLHFHVADASSPLGAEGRPYSLSGAAIVGRYESIAAFEGGAPWRAAPEPSPLLGLPGPNAVVMFEP